MFRQLRAQCAAEILRHHVRARARNKKSRQPFFARLVFLRRHDGFLHEFRREQRGLNFVQIHALPANFHKLIRAALDKLRRGATAATAVEAGSIRPDPVVTGYVKRSDGKSTVFIDKQPYPMQGRKLQEKLEPRIVQRYLEPTPVVPPPVPVLKESEDKNREPEAAKSRPSTE